MKNYFLKIPNSGNPHRLERQMERKLTNLLILTIINISTNKVIKLLKNYLTCLIFRWLSLHLIKCFVNLSLWDSSLFVIFHLYLQKVLHSPVGHFRLHLLREKRHSFQQCLTIIIQQNLQVINNRNQNYMCALYLKKKTNKSQSLVHCMDHNLCIADFSNCVPRRRLKCGTKISKKLVTI